MEKIKRTDDQEVDWDYAMQQAVDHLTQGDEIMFRNEGPLDIALVGYHFTSAAVWLQFAEAWNRRESSSGEP